MCFMDCIIAWRDIMDCNQEYRTSTPNQAHDRQKLFRPEGSLPAALRCGNSYFSEIAEYPARSASIGEQ